jgi:uncharacterized protein (TIGR03437 family)
MTRIYGGAWFLFLLGSLSAQTFNNQALNGKFYFRHLMFTTDTSANIADIRSLSGAITFDGLGNFAYNGQQTVGANPAGPVNGGGTYTVSPAAIVSLANPQNASLAINARYGTVGANEGMIIGSTTETSGNTFDLFIAIQAPNAPTSNASLNGSYNVTMLGFPDGAGDTARDGLFNLVSAGSGTFADISISGHAANISNGAPVTQVISGATYIVAADGSGSAAFPVSAASQLLSGSEQIYVSANGSVILGGSMDPGVHDVLIGFKAATGTPWNDKFWHAGLRFDTAGAADSYSGSLFSNNNGTVTFTRRFHQLEGTGAIAYDFTGANPYTLQSDGTGTAGLTSIALGANGNGFVGTAQDPHDVTGYELDLGIRMPALTGSGVFLNPQGVVNGASFAPAGDSIAPGEFITLFGSNLAPGTQTATPPYPPALGGVSVVINGRQAPIYLISSGQINALVPYALSGSIANIAVNNNGTASNTVSVPVAATAPGVFSLNRTGIGPGAILHANFSLVNAAKPAKVGETILVFLTGLGAVNPPVADGTAGGASKAAAPVNVLIGGVTATVSYAGLAPGFPGLYQLNVIVPADLVVTATGPFPLAIQTPDSFNDQVDLILGP